METEGNDEKRLIAVHEFVNRQVNDFYCRQPLVTVGVPEFLTQVVAIDRYVQKVIPTSLRTRLLCQLHYPTLVGNMGERGTYDMIIREHYWPHIAK